MTTVEVIFFAIGIWFTATIIALGIWLAAHRTPQRRGGLLDLTPPSDARKNARVIRAGELELDPEHLTGSGCRECRQPYGWAHLQTCSGSRARGGAGMVGFREKTRVAS